MDRRLGLKTIAIAAGLALIAAGLLLWFYYGRDVLVNALVAAAAWCF